MRPEQRRAELCMARDCMRPARPCGSPEAKLVLAPCGQDCWNGGSCLFVSQPPNGYGNYPLSRFAALSLGNWGRVGPITPRPCPCLSATSRFGLCRRTSLMAPGSSGRFITCWETFQDYKGVWLATRSFFLSWAFSSLSSLLLHPAPDLDLLQGEEDFNVPQSEMRACWRSLPLPPTSYLSLHSRSAPELKCLPPNSSDSSRRLVKQGLLNCECYDITFLCLRFQDARHNRNDKQAGWL